MLLGHCILSPSFTAFLKYSQLDYRGLEVQRPGWFVYQTPLKKCMCPSSERQNLPNVWPETQILLGVHQNSFLHHQQKSAILPSKHLSWNSVRAQRPSGPRSGTGLVVTPAVMVCSCPTLSLSRVHLGCQTLLRPGSRLHLIAKVRMKCSNSVH